MGNKSWIGQQHFCFNVESTAELEVINTLASQRNKVANVAFRINPNIGAHTHANITTGLAENKFGITMDDLEKTIEISTRLKNISVIGLHFHIGSQILDMDDFKALSNRINDLQCRLKQHGIVLPNINVGGGLGINYEHPDIEPIPDFAGYFSTYAKHLRILPDQKFTLNWDDLSLGNAEHLSHTYFMLRTALIKIRNSRCRNDRSHSPRTISCVS